MTPRLTYLVSVYHRPQCIWGMVGSLLVQTEPNIEILVLDNSRVPEVNNAHLHAIHSMNDDRVRWIHSYHSEPGSWDCYWSADWAIKEGFVHGEYVCFASDDSLYCPEFSAKMLAAASANDWDLVYCDILYDSRMNGGQSRVIMEGIPVVCHIDKTQFIVRRERWTGFPHPYDDHIVGSCADGEGVAEMVRRGCRHGHVPDCLLVHN